MPRGKPHPPAVGEPRERGGRPRLRLFDVWLLRLAVGPLALGLGVTLTAFLLERALRLVAELSAANGRWAYLSELLVTLSPHYVGLTLPAAFFLALFLVFARLSDGSEIDSMLAAGLSLDRIAAPFLALGVLLALVSLLLSGWVQPQARYAYRALLHAAESGGWNGRLQGGLFVASDAGTTMTADSSDAGGRKLRRVWIRQVIDGQTRITTARRARLHAGADSGHVVLALSDGQQVRHDNTGRPDVLAFRLLEIALPLPAGDRSLRARGEDERELTLTELAGRPPAGADPTTPRRKRRAELYGRIARALALPLLPLLAAPLSLSAKRGGRALSLVVAASVLFGFQHLLQLGEGIGGHGKVPPLVAVGAPWLLFAALCVWMWRGGRASPGQTPVARLADRIALIVDRLRDARRTPAARVKAAA